MGGRKPAQLITHFRIFISHFLEALWFYYFIKLNYKKKTQQKN